MQRNLGKPQRMCSAKNVFCKEPVSEGEAKLDEKRLAQTLKEEKRRKTRRDDDGRLGKQTRGDEPYKVTEEQFGKSLAYDHICVY